MTLDHHARRAADELRGAVADRVRLGPAATVPRRNRAVTTMVATAAAVATVFGLLAFTTGGDGSADTVFEVSQLELNPLAPNDGRDSQRLPVTADPVEGLTDRGVITLIGEGHLADDELGIVMCSATAQTRGIDGCDISSVGYVTTAADGTFATTFEVRRVIDVPLEGTVDCAEYPERCLVGVGSLADYDRSGGALVTFADSGPLPPAAELAADPVSGLVDGQDVRLVASGFVPGSTVWATQCGGDVGCQTIPQPAEITASDLGTVGVTVRVARYLPGLTRTAGDDHYDCVEYACSLQLSGDTGLLRQAPSIPLTFDPAGPTRPVPELSVTPSSELVPGDVLTVTGRGFRTGAQVTVALCGEPREGDYGRCFRVDGDEGQRLTLTVDETGSFAVALPAPSRLEPAVPPEPPTEGDVDAAGTITPPIDCLAAEGACAVWVFTYNAFDDLPSLSPQPVPLVFATG